MAQAALRIGLPAVAAVLGLTACRQLYAWLRSIGDKYGGLDSVVSYSSRVIAGEAA